MSPLNLTRQHRMPALDALIRSRPWLGMRMQFTRHALDASNSFTRRTCFAIWEKARKGKLSSCEAAGERRIESTSPKAKDQRLRICARAHEVSKTNNTSTSGRASTNTSFAFIHPLIPCLFTFFVVTPSSVPSFPFTHATLEIDTAPSIPSYHAIIGRFERI